MEVDKKLFSRRKILAKSGNGSKPLGLNVKKRHLTLIDASIHDTDVTERFIIKTCINIRISYILTRGPKKICFICLTSVCFRTQDELKTR